MNVASSLNIRTVIPFAIAVALAASGMAQVPDFSDSFDGPDLDSGWARISPGTHDGFAEPGHYTIRGSRGTSTGLRRSIGGRGDFTVELSLQLDPFFLAGAGGTRSDLKIRFAGAGAWFEVVLNSFRSLRVTSSELGGNLQDPITVLGIEDGDHLSFQFAYNEGTSTMSVNYAINEGLWEPLASGSGITPTALQSAEIVLFRFGNNESAMPRMKLDRYEIFGAEQDSATRGLRIVADGEQCNIRWNSTPGRLYGIEQSDDLLQWETVANQIPASPP